MTLLQILLQQEASYLRKGSDEWFDLVEEGERALSTLSSSFRGTNIGTHLVKCGVNSEWLRLIKGVNSRSNKTQFGIDIEKWKPGQTWIPLIDKVSGKGCVALLKVSESHQDFTDDRARDAITSAHDVVRLYLAKTGHADILPSERWGIKIYSLTGELLRGDRLTGGSLAFSSALAILSLMADSALPKDIAVTGELGTNGKILLVDGVKEKGLALAREIPAFRTLYVSDDYRGNPGGFSLCRMDTFADAVNILLRVDVTDRIVRGIDFPKVVEEAEGSFKRGNHSRVAEIARRYEKFGSRLKHYSKEQWELAWLHAAALAHQGKTVDALARFRMVRKEGMRLCGLGRKGKGGIISRLEYYGMLNRYANTLIPVFLFSRSASFLKECLKNMPIYLDRVLRGKICGTYGQVLMYSGRNADARGFLKEALASAKPDERPRNLCYLGVLEARCRKYKSARDYLERGLIENRKSGMRGEEKKNGAFLYATYAELSARQGRWKEAGEHVSEGLKCVDDYRKIYNEILFNPYVQLMRNGFRCTLNANPPSGKPITIDNVLEVGDKSESPILKLLSRVACLDEWDFHVRKDGDSEIERMGKIQEFLALVREYPNGLFWFGSEIRAFQKYLISPRKYQNDVRLAITSIKERMPYL